MSRSTSENRFAAMDRALSGASVQPAGTAEKLASRISRGRPFKPRTATSWLVEPCRSLIPATVTSRRATPSRRASRSSRSKVSHEVLSSR